MPLVIVADAETGQITIRYDLAWLLEVMTVSSSSMVAFTLFSAALVVDNRLYTRSNGPGFILHGEEQINASPSSGGRRRPRGSRVAELCELFAGNQDLPLPLNDIAILSKRAVCRLSSANGCKYLTINRGLVENDKRAPAWPVYPYPMLCILGQPHAHFPMNQAHWRVIQCVFGALLTRNIRAAGIGVEVVSREGFGSVFPTLADIPNGIRLDPGLLPPDAGAAAISQALRDVDAFTCAMQVRLGAVASAPKAKAKQPPPKKAPTLPAAIGRLGGMAADNLAAVDRLMSVLHGAIQGSSSVSADALVDVILTYNGAGLANYRLPAPKSVDKGVSYTLADVFRLRSTAIKKRVRIPDPEDTGYGSESDYDDDELPPPTLKPPKPKKVRGGNPKGFSVKKATVVSGMAALRMATSYGLRFARAVNANKERTRSGLTRLLTWAPYFELDHQALYQAILSNGGLPIGTNVFICDGAPNPINIPEQAVVLPESMQLILIDTTNNTSAEKAAYLGFFGKYLQAPSESGPGGLLFMVDSGSKHPTGGDLVHGVMRVCGPRPSVETYFDGLLGPHLKIKGARDLTVLGEHETELRRRLIASRLVMRNADLFNALPGSKGSPTGSSKPVPESTPPSSLPPSSAPEVRAPPLLAEANAGSVVRIALSADQVLERLKPKPKPKPQEPSKPSTGESTSSTKPLPLPKPKPKPKPKLEPKVITKLTKAGHYYSEEDIYDLQRYLFRATPDVAVLPGVSRLQFLQMTRQAYTTAVHLAIRSTTHTIIQPLHRNGNHWALMYFRLGPRRLNGTRSVRMLYIDPLHPDDVPAADLALLQLPFPGIEIERCTIQYQDDGIAGQHSCGAWAVELAAHLVNNGDQLPNVSVDRRGAAILLRQAHEAIIATARAHPLPVAPGQAFAELGPPIAQPGAALDDMNVPRSASLIPDQGRRLQRRGSFGSSSLRR